MASVPESEKAALSTRRGHLAAGIKDPAKRQAFVKEQGDVDAKGGKDTDYAQLYNKTQGEETAQALQSYHKGGMVKESGPANLKKGEMVVPKNKVAKMKKGHPSLKIFHHE